MKKLFFTILFISPLSFAQAQVPGLEFLGIGTNAGIGDILNAIYRFGLGLVGISALVMLVVGGVMYMTAGDSQDRAKQGREFATNAIYGLVLALLSWLILFTINPDLINRLQTPTIDIQRAATIGGVQVDNTVNFDGSSDPVGDCQKLGGTLAPIGGHNICITSDAEQKQKINGSSDRHACEGAGGQVVVMPGSGNVYCSKPFK